MTIDDEILRNAESNEIVKRLRAAHGRGGNSSILCGKAANEIVGLIVLLTATQQVLHKEHLELIAAKEELNRRFDQPHHGHEPE
jgi:hypothetical protein